METLKRMTPLISMTLFKRQNNFMHNRKVGIRNEPYLIINIFLAGVILLIIAYSGIFSPDKGNHPVACIHEKITGEPCISCGLSHSFSLIARGRIEEASQWNKYGMRVFLFFFSQLILRIVFSFFYIKNTTNRQQLIIFDSIGSGLIFLIAFWPYMCYIAKGFF